MDGHVAIGAFARRVIPAAFGAAARVRVTAAACGAVLLLLAAPVAAQEKPAPEKPAPISPAPNSQDPAVRIREQREELERIRRERADLESRMRQLQGTVHDLSEERNNLDRQADATEAAVRSLDRQLLAIDEGLDETTGDLVIAQDELALKRAVLRRRLADVYKRGPLYTVQALLTAQSFGELVSRYKYLHLLALRDKAIVSRVEALEARIGNHRQQLVRLQGEMAMSRAEKAEEEKRLRVLEQERSASLRTVQRQARQAATRLAQLTKDEARLGSLIATLETARKKAEAARPAGAPAASATSTLRTTDVGKLNWPVDGTIIYRFGRVVNPDNTTVRWNGIGIAATQGSAVRAVSSGEVMVAEAIGTYGQTVIIQHGGGDYSVYGSLGTIEVQKGQQVTKGQAIGTVGATDPELPAHLHFEIRPKGRAMDPLVWLKNQP
ncbi:MAG: peptidoglycan DD-metalloendopeptidase family protein [Gemmatimonadetes bacterium]|nr:peptidoglycan DD-metalloendopeptidase family protein [Gemmatimonadota bacterium]